MTFAAIGVSLMLAWTGTAWPQPTAGQRENPIPQPTKKIIYKTVGDRELPLHVFEPAGHKATDKRPALVYFHGGVWGQDSTRNFHPLCAYFAQRGMWVANAEFRLVPKGSSLLPDKLDVEFMIEDVKDVLRYVRGHATELGVDPERIVAAGNSSGGHLAAAVAVFPEKDGKTAETVSCRPNLLVLIAPALFLKLAGGRLQPEYFTKETPPTIQIVGTEDGTMLPFVKTVLELGKKQGFSVEAYTAEGLGHEFGRHENWTHLMWYQVDRFLAKHGYLQGEPTMKPPDGIEFQQLK